MKNMKLTLGLLSLALFTSCQSTPSSSQSDNEQSDNEQTELKSEKFVKTFLQEHRNWDINDITKRNTNDTFKLVVKDQLRDNFLDDFPLELGEINEYKKGKFAAVFASHYTKNNVEYKSILNNIKFDIIGLIPDSLVQTLQKDKKYLVNGKFIRFLSDDFKNYINGMVYTNEVKIDNDIISKNLEVSLGIMLFEVQSVTMTKSL
jgi:hypothetical protein